MENSTTNMFVLSLVEQAIQHITLRVIESLGPAIDAKVEAAINVAWATSGVVSSSNPAFREAVMAVENDELFPRFRTALNEDPTFVSMVNQHVSDYLDAAPLVETLKNDEAFQKDVKQWVEDYMDDNRWITRTDEAIDNITSRLDDLEDDGSSGISGHLRNAIQDEIDTKISAADLITNDNLAGEVERILNAGNFSFSV